MTVLLRSINTSNPLADADFYIDGRKSKIGFVDGTPEFTGVTNPEEMTDMTITGDMCHIHDVKNGATFTIEYQKHWVTYEISESSLREYSKTDDRFFRPCRLVRVFRKDNGATIYYRDENSKGKYIRLPHDKPLFFIDPVKKDKYKSLLLIPVFIVLASTIVSFVGAAILLAIFIAIILKYFD